MKVKGGYFKILLYINLSNGVIEKKSIPSIDILNFLGGRGLGIKLLNDIIKEPGIDAFSEENPLMFMPGPFSGFPIPSASRVCIVTKSPCTSPINSKYPFASTISYSNMGGFLGPEIKFAGYDGIVITGKASSPVYLVIEDENVEIRDASKFWGMNTDLFDKKFNETLGDNKFETCYIGPAGENMVSYSCIIHTAARAAARGVGAIMGSKKLKAIAIKGTKMPDVFDHKQFLSLIKKSPKFFKGVTGGILRRLLRNSGTAYFLEEMSNKGLMAVKNYREGTFVDVEKIGHKASKTNAWKRNFACYCCHLSCKKSGLVKDGPYAGTIVHDGPEYETGTLFGSNLMLSDLGGLLKAIYDGDDYGLDIISTGNVIGFLMEAYEKKYIDKSFIDGIDLKWGDTEAILKMIEKIAKREGIGDLASKGVKALAEKIGFDSKKFACHVKGLELAAHNVHANPYMGISYTTTNRGACHLNGYGSTSIDFSIKYQNFLAVCDSLGICLFSVNHTKCYMPGYSLDYFVNLLYSITGIKWQEDELLRLGERIYNLEKKFNYREGFRREDDILPDRFFEEPLTIGKQKGAVLNHKDFDQMMITYYEKRGWDPLTSKPGKAKLKKLGLA
ncbi:aldehyde ferredoxin oxidoreductase [Candidatus Magnetomorum sp. HK-1]|nr:aldehyde ferredoxin oxidoreductase [Candidatus Magnetomorum sp. HK-1]